MIVLYSCIFSIFIWILPIVHSQSLQSTSNSSKNSLGSAACFLYGDYNMVCKLETVLCKDLPSECDSIIWETARVGLTYDVKDPNGKKSDEYFKKILSCSTVPIFVTYGYLSLSVWSLVLACSGANGINVEDEAKGLIAYLNEHKTITGILLSSLDVTPDQKKITNLTANLKSYITALRKLVPIKHIGLIFYGDYIQKHYDNPSFDWIDFNVIYDLVDSIFISFNTFNPVCSEEFKHTGMAPITGNAALTIQKVQDHLDKVGVKKDKLYYRFELYAEPDKGQPSVCRTGFDMMCKDPKKSVNWCSDTIASFHEKGVFARLHGNGFGGGSTDHEDVHCVCQCGRSYPGFRAILDGFKGNPVPPSCALFDRC